MFSQLKQRIKTIQDRQLVHLLKGAKTGIEKESLRVNTQGGISQSNHPIALGSALTHPLITTDYAESLLELITPPCQSSIEAYQCLLDIETYVYQHIGDELLWTSSMPCVVNAESDIRIAEYGSSNAGRMKSIYRHGLAWRYGKAMQVIAGIHFNYSIAEAFWPAFQQMENSNIAPQAFINERYMGMTRNIQRYGWLIPYLFGSSPAICKSFLQGVAKPENMAVLNEFTYYEPKGTSLRMGDIGYTNRKENKVGVKANYNSLQKYTQSLESAISTPCPNYQEIGVKVAGEYRQLSDKQLQIENEYYSSVRPKQILEGNERPIDALRKRGIQYIELRSLDLNPFQASGISQEQLFFLEVFMHFCLLQDSPKINNAERKEIDGNQNLVAHQGRTAGLILQQMGHKITLDDSATMTLNAMYDVAVLLDQAHNSQHYQAALEKYSCFIAQSELTPSARLLTEIRQYNESFFSFAKRKSCQHREFFQQRSLSEAQQEQFTLMATQSLQQQYDNEAQTELPFDRFLLHYLAGTL
jgi:glutamate--cysteine ligase